MNSKDGQQPHNPTINNIGGLAASHLPDQFLQTSKQAQQTLSDANAGSLLSVLRRDSAAAPTSSTLQFENAAGLLDELEDSDDEPPRPGEKRSGRRKIKIEYIEDKSRRHITFSKRKAGIMKKAYELSTLTGTQVLLLVASETGHVYTFATPKLQPLITKQEGKNLIQACLNSPDHHVSNSNVGVGISSHQNHSHGLGLGHSHDHLAQSTTSVDYGSGPFDTDLTEEELSVRSGSTAAAAALHAYLPQGNSNVNSNLINTSGAIHSNNSSANSVASVAAAAAAQVFMNPVATGQYSTSPSGGGYQQSSNPTPPSAYWNTSSNGMYAPIPSKSQQQQQHQQQQQQQQQQMYHALLQQQQLYQQYHNQQQQQQQHKSHDSNDI